MGLARMERMVLLRPLRDVLGTRGSPGVGALRLVLAFAEGPVRTRCTPDRTNAGLGPAPCGIAWIQNCMSQAREMLQASNDNDLH